jgi:hypothetical protein
MKELTYRNLREALTAVDNQYLTVKELREILFQIEDQDSEVKESKIFRMTYAEEE